MIILGLLCIIILLCWICSVGATIAVGLDNEMWKLDEVFDPYAKYLNSNLNWFGIIFTTIISYLFLFPMAVIYWFYRLCTIRRR